MADWKSILSSIAPTAVTLLAGPYAGLAMPFVTKALGLDTSSAKSPTDAVAMVQKTLTENQLTGDQILALKQAETDLQKHLADNDIEIDKLTAADVADARKRETDLAKAGAKDGTPATLAYIIIGGFFVVCIAQMVALMGWPDQVTKIPAQAWVIIGNISGYLASEAKQAAAYYFGSTIGSKDKDVTIDKALNS